jgi:hypothetical protein
MSRDIESHRVSTGLNTDLGAWKDNHYVTCSRCGFICNTDRDVQGKEGSRQGWGIQYGDDATMDDKRFTMSDIGLYMDGYWIGSRVERDVQKMGCPLCGTLMYTKEVW